MTGNSTASGRWRQNLGNIGGYGVRRQPPRFGFGAARTDSAHSRVRSLRGLGPSIQLSKIQDYLLDDQCIYMLSEESRQIKTGLCTSLKSGVQSSRSQGGHLDCVEVYSVDKNDWYFAISSVLAILALLGLDWKLVKGRLPMPQLGWHNSLFVFLIVASLAVSAIGCTNPPSTKITNSVFPMRP